MEHRLKKVCYKVSLCENCQRQSCKAFNWPINYPCKNDWWGQPLYLKFWVKVTALERNRQFSSLYIFARSASAVTP